MKAIVQIGLWKAIAFLTVVFFFSCTACDPEVEIKPQVSIGVAENVTDSSATLVAYVTPNGEAEIYFSYKTDNSAWLTTKLVTKFNGNTAVKVSFDLKDLQAGTNYQFKVEAINKAGSTPSELSSFTTVALVKAVVIINPATEIKITSAKVSALVTPNEESTVSFEYQSFGSAWVTQTLPTSFSGKNAISVNFDLKDLQANTNYSFRVRVNSKAGESVSETATFETYAVSDFDGNLYHIVTIGTQVWLRENFKGTHFLNGDPIPNITDQAQWEAATSPAYCYYNNDIKNADTYGALYNWYVASDSRGLISGYHVSTFNDWESLSSYLGGFNVSGGKLKEVGNYHWQTPNTGATNSSNFTALPGGQKTINNFCNLGDASIFWAATNYTVSGSAYVYYLDKSSTSLGRGGAYHYYGSSLRLVKN